MKTKETTVDVEEYQFKWSGVALKLSERELYDITQKYGKERGIEFDFNAEVRQNRSPDVAYDFLKSDYIPTKEDPYFQVQKVPQVSNILFAPWKIDGSLNRKWKKDRSGAFKPNHKYREEKCSPYNYVIYPDNNLNFIIAGSDTDTAYCGILQEYKNKIGKYVPQDFDWEKHIGELEITV